MGTSNMGNCRKKSNNNEKMSKKFLIYGYDNHRWTHQPRVVYDSETSTRMSLCWDANGNLFHVQDCAGKRGRFHDWDEENRLRMVIGSKSAGYYGYDANGDRVYKLTGESSIDFLGQGIADATVQFDDAVLYPNPYLTITPTGYTKHYYANSERLSTVLGEGGWFLMSKDAISDLTQDEEHDIGHAFDRYSEHFPLGLPSAVLTQNKDIDEQVVQELQYDCPQNTLVSIDLDCTMNPNALYSRMYRNLAVNGTETNVYYTHNDHLGSASWITDRYAHPTQYLHYLPYGQLLANQKATTYDERYKFIGKERDMESGYDYFGARYYIAPFLHFASVEPLLDKYLHISPYSYAAWNPIKFIDQDGSRCKLSVNGNSITISANYYASRSDSRYAMKGANFWNSQKGLTYTAKDGTNYSVQFDLRVYSSKNPEKAAGTDDNSFKIVSTLGNNEDGYKKTGGTIANYKISVADAYKEESTSAHEIGHTLMNIQEGKDSEHATTGIMTKSINDEGRSWSVPQETVNNIVESNGFYEKSQTLLQKIKSWFE